jgi:uncharacterized protein YbaA (DUF1428 family)
VAAIVWYDPGAHWNEHGAVHGVPSTLTDRPDGEVATVIGAVKFAITVFALFIVTASGLQR